MEEEKVAIISSYRTELWVTSSVGKALRLAVGGSIQWEGPESATELVDIRIYGQVLQGRSWFLDKRLGEGMIDQRKDEDESKNERRHLRIWVKEGRYKSTSPGGFGISAAVGTGA